MTGRRKRLRSVIALFTAIVLGACAEQGPVKNPRFKLKRPSASIMRQLTLAGPEALPSVVIAELASNKSVVHFGRNGAKGLLVARAGGKWAAGRVRVSKSGEGAVEDDAQLTEIAPAPESPGPVALGAHGAGFVFVWASPVAAGHELWAAVLDAHGTLVGNPRSAGRTFERVTWIEVQSTDAQPTRLIWETEEGKRSTLFSAQLPKSHETPDTLGPLVTVTRDAVGWQAATGPSGMVLAWVDGEPGRLRVVAVDKDARLSQTTVLTEGATALSDVQVTALDDRFFVGWTDTRAGDHHVHVAQIDGSAKLLTPGKPVLSPVGGQALVSLIASQDRKRVLLAWERDLGVALNPRHIQLSLLDPLGALAEERAAIDFYAAEGTPHLVADGGGFTALTIAPLVQREEVQPDPVLGPVFVRFNARLAVRAAEPIRVAQLKHQAVAMEGVPELVHGLHCQTGLCSVVATGAGKPALMALVSLPARRSSWRAPARLQPRATPPLVASLDTLVDVREPVADMSTAVLADGRTLVVWVTHALRSTKTDDGAAPATATLAFRFVENGKVGPIHTLSKRAVSDGGVDVLALPAGKGGDPVALIGWAGPANGTQVYASLIRKDGSKKIQKTITKIARRKKKKGFPNEVYDVVVAHDGHKNFLFSWSDSRDGNPEIYVARVNPQLQKNKRDMRLSVGAGASLEPQLMVTQDRVLVAFSDASETGAANIFVAELDGKTLAMKGSAHSIESSSAHSRTPRWAGQAKSLALSWIDEAVDDTPSALRLVSMDDHGKTTAAARRLRADSGATVTSRLVSCTQDTCRGLLGASDSGVLQLAPFSAPRESGAPIVAAVTNMFGGGSPQDVMMISPNGSAGIVVFVDHRPGTVRIRRLALRW